MYNLNVIDSCTSYIPPKYISSSRQEQATTVSFSVATLTIDTTTITSVEKQRVMDQMEPVL